MFLEISRVLNWLDLNRLHLPRVYAAALFTGIYQQILLLWTAGKQLFKQTRKESLMELKLTLTLIKWACMNYWVLVASLQIYKVTFIKLLPSKLVTMRLIMGSQSQQNVWTKMYILAVTKQKQKYRVSWEQRPSKTPKITKLEKEEPFSYTCTLLLFLVVWLAIEERVSSVELHLCVKWYCWRESRAKVLKNADAILSYFSFDFTEKFQSSLCTE